MEKDKQNDIFARLSGMPGFAFAPYALLIMAVLLAYANAYRGAFLYDDILAIVQNMFLRHWSNLSDLLTSLSLKGAGRVTGFYRPLTMLLWFLTYQAFGPSAPAFHLLNVALHVTNACLVFRLGCRLNFRLQGSFAAALLWGVHPLLTEAVTYISAMAEPLYSFFCLLGLVILLPDFAPRKFWLASVLFVFSLASKESAIVFPALVTITLFLVNKDRLRPATYLRTWPLWLLAGVYVVGWLIFLHTSAVASALVHDPADTFYYHNYVNNYINRTLTCLSTLPVYFSLIIWPMGLHMDRSYPIFNILWDWRVITGTVMVAGVILQILWGRAQCGLALSWGFLWFAVAQLPNTGLLIPADAFVFEHWMYLPTVGIAIGLSETAAAWLDGKSEKARLIATALVAVATLALGVKTHLQNQVWRDPGTFYENIIQSGEFSGRAYNNLAVFYEEQGEFAKAIGYFNLAIVHPDPLPQAMIPDLHTNLAMAYLRVRFDQGDLTLRSRIQSVVRVLPFASQIPEAIKELNKALELNPDSFWPNQCLALIYAYEGDYVKASLYRDRAKVDLQNTVPHNY